MRYEFNITTVYSDFISLSNCNDSALRIVDFSVPLRENKYVMQEDARVPSNAVTCNFTRGTSRVFMLFMNPTGTEIYTRIETVDRQTPRGFTQKTRVFSGIDVIHRRYRDFIGEIRREKNSSAFIEKSIRAILAKTGKRFIV